MDLRDKKEIALKIKEYFESYCDFEDVTFTEDYSGKFMYGRECVGYICEPRAKLNILANLTVYLTKHGIDLSKYSMKEDDMGLDKIIYFPFLRI